MLEEPYRWVEAIQNRREYLDDQLRAASPVVGLSYESGILLLTTTPGPRKLFEVYNDLSFAAIGHPADIEKLRKAVIDIAHLEAFNFSASDVSLQRLVSFGIGPLIKAAFDEIFRSPFTARVLMAELDPQTDRDRFFVIDADGSFRGQGEQAAVAGSEVSVAAILESLGNEGAERSLSQAMDAGLQAWAAGRLNLESETATLPDTEAVESCLRETLESQRVEAAVLDRTRPGKSKFELLSAEDIDAALVAYR
jgi:proteasome alpha subunit